MNYTNIIKRCIEELSKDDFRKDYVLGMLETIYEVENEPVLYSTSDKGMVQITPKDDEAQMLDAQTKARLGIVKESIKYD